MNKTTILFVILLLASAGLPGQKFPGKGVPLISNYTPEQYGDAGKVWAIRAAENSMLYFATDQGLLEFDGQRWNRFAGSKGFTRSLLVTSDSVIYTGADQDFGRWNLDRRQQFNFISLNPFRESNKGLNEEFWGVYQIQEDQVFVSFDNIYVYRKEQLTKISAPTRFYGSTCVEDRLYLFDEDNGVYEFDGLNLTLLFSFPPDNQDPPRVVGIDKAGDRLVVVTRDRGIFQFSDGNLMPVASEVAPFLQSDQVFCFTRIEDTHYAFGTILNGVYITDRAGNIVQHVNKQKGLLNNTVLSIYYSPQGKLWLGLDFGVASLELWSDVTYFLDERGQVGTGQTGLLHQGTFYLGTNQGLYTIPWEELRNDASLPDFRLVPGSSGQVWSLKTVGEDVLCGHDRGLFRVAGNAMIPLHGEAGVLAIQPLDKDHLLTGNYNGISLFEKRNNRWTFAKKIPPVQGACNQLLPENDRTLWLNLPNFGIIRATLGEDFRITEQKIFPGQDFAGELPEIFRDSGAVRVMAPKATFTYQSDKQEFTKDDTPVPTLKIRNALAGNYRAIPLSPSYGFIPVNNGFALKNSEYLPPPSISAPLTIRSVVSFNNDTSVLISEGATIPFNRNNLRVYFTIPQQHGATYQYRIAGKAEAWSAWSPHQEFELLDLPPGTYELELRARVDEEIMSQKTFTFIVAPPWAHTVWAYTLYALLAALLLYLNYRWQEYKRKQQKELLLQKEKISQQLRAAAEEQENVLKKFAMLDEAFSEIKKQLRNKTIQLAKKAKESDEKSRVLQALKEKIDPMLENTPPNKFQLTQLSRILAEYPDNEDNSFMLQLDELHQEFTGRLGAQYTDLTTYDLRLAIYIKSGMTTREIAELMNVLPSSVNVSRSRLRKKLQLSSKKDLYKFLSQFA